MFSSMLLCLLRAAPDSRKVPTGEQVNLEHAAMPKSAASEKVEATGKYSTWNNQTATRRPLVGTVSN